MGVSRLLLDTHIWLWLRTTPERLPTRTLDRIADPDTEVLISAASSWEISIKYRLGRLDLPQPPSRWIPRAISAMGATPLAVEHAHAAVVAALPMHHRDPFDRLLIAQAQLLRAPIVTADDVFDAYAVRTIRI